jgi:uncharacterized membrane protein HdeD (DUF308 family)
MKHKNQRQSSLPYILSGILALFLSANALFLKAGLLDRFFSVLGIVVIVSGLVMLFSSLWQKHKGHPFLATLFASVLLTLFGIALFFFTGTSVKIAMVLVGAWFVLLSLYQGYHLVMLKPSGNSRIIVLISGLLGLGYGILLLFHPMPEVRYLINLTGLLALAEGVLLIWLGFNVLTYKKR